MFWCKIINSLPQSHHFLVCSNSVRLLYPLSVKFNSTSTPEPTDDDETPGMVNISRLPRTIRNRMKHVSKFDEKVLQVPRRSEQAKRTFHRILYAAYGKKSGVNPCISWPSEKELKNIMRDEEEYQPSFHEMVQTMKEQKLLEAEERTRKEEYVAAQVEKMPAYIENFKLKRSKVIDTVKLKRESSKKLLEEAQDHYGYKVSANDPRFKEYLTQKREEEKLARKKLKKEKATMQSQPIAASN